MYDSEIGKAVLEHWDYVVGNEKETYKERRRQMEGKVRRFKKCVRTAKENRGAIHRD